MHSRHPPVTSDCFLSLAVGNTSEDLLEDLDKISSLQSNLKLKKPMRLLPFPPARDYKYCKFEGVSCLSVLLFPHLFLSFCNSSAESPHGKTHWL